VTIVTIVTIPSQLLIDLSLGHLYELCGDAINAGIPQIHLNRGWNHLWLQVRQTERPSPEMVVQIQIVMYVVEIPVSPLCYLLAIIGRLTAVTFRQRILTAHTIQDAETAHRTHCLHCL
jgi:hypothetical protein